MTEKSAKPAASKPTRSRKPSTRRRKPDQDEISTRAYFIHLVSEDLIGAPPVRTVTKHIVEQRDAASSTAGTPSDAPK